MRAVLAKDVLAVRRSKAVVLPMLIVPVLLLVVLPLAVGLAARSANPPGAGGFLEAVPERLADAVRSLPESQQLLVLVDGYLLAPLFMIVPLMVASVLAADAFAGEKERKTLEGLLHLPIAERDLFYAKVGGAFLPAMAVSWIGFLLFVVIANTIGWSVMHRLFLPTRLWLLMMAWVAPAVAALGMGVMVRVSARARTSQEANQLGGAVVLPLIFLVVGQSTGLLLLSLPVVFAVGAVVWVVALFLLNRGARRFTRDAMLSTT